MTARKFKTADTTPVLFDAEINETLGRKDASNVKSVALSNEDLAKLETMRVLLNDLKTLMQDTTPSPVKSAGQEYEDCAHGATTTLGVVGALGDVLSHLIVIPEAANCGSVSIKDGGDTAIVVFPGGGTVALTDLSSRMLGFDLKSRTGAWQIVCGTNVRVLAAGEFTDA